MLSDQTEKKFQRILSRTANRISDELNKMIADLPEDIAPQAAYELLLGHLVHRQRWFMELVMEDENIRNSYYEQLSRIPADPSRKDRGSI